ncbi:MAG: hypothetical protein UW46_C0006G0012 [Candidatus Yanofskybacteria bacterium GW2011_GWF1_44_227]|uniref:Uncharacterized protein n=1 Tax=Candidatus Yanofskybacteria bacterium GW2011_GWE2_40_11 TaxID=1619033 RepID=A0A0G0QUI6_9BACT|nr:MAG: hypothetical protein UT69_C0002G0007 [Candidatus Yanofskybacteria bacterium GW2011_GWE1_40_10]KKR41026.1 MAG: hypothetical protein UT75_C0002G0063 [Candidatus Yanofskybacteria bacterium GW2011_GWE2_40_11]KKT15473.1 MAG: hypothetical protein UV97_C0006G0040 [Candidatus Yanofskybacteria bacterium GW2011_GWF2_43_596]KKT53111.1 MAG: hypothetical protein UW46_C0006G0012 [Candidatus Yanofskybacteria bacterium GW2011_GWF1_44_227]OGN35537.1 MAG: hypothetical protein A2207_02235 [Candidatus Yano
MKVTVLEKPTGGTWSRSEVEAIMGTMTEVEQLPRLPNRIVLMNKPLRGSISCALGHTNYVAREVDYHDRWA